MKTEDEQTTDSGSETSSQDLPAPPPQRKRTKFTGEDIVVIVSCLVVVGAMVFGVVHLLTSFGS